MSGRDDGSGTYDRPLVSGARVGSLGTIAKVMHPAFLIVATRLYGPAAVGIYVIATSLLEFATSLLVTGFKDGIVVFAARRDAEREDQARAEIDRLVATSLWVCGLAALVLTGALWIFGQALVDALLSRDAAAAALGEEVAAVLPVLLWAIPAITVLELSVAATRSLMIMTYDTLLLGFLKPVALLVFAIVAFFVSPDARGLVTAFVAAHAVLALCGVWAFARHFALRPLARSLLRPRWHRELLVFAGPQGLNTTLNTFITRVDVLMLAYFGTEAALIAFYRTAADLVRNVRQAKLAFSAAFAPVIARLHAEGRTLELAARFAMVSRWATTIAVPGLLVVLGLRRELLLVFDETYVHDSTFMLLLAVAPFLSCYVGLAGNIVAMTGHSRWNLLNSATVGITNAVLNALLIPRFGLLGAAIGTAIASTAVSLLQVWEARRLCGVGFRAALVAKPLLAGLAATAVAALVLVPADGALWRIVGVAVGVVVYVVVLRALGLDPRDRDLFRLRKPRLDPPEPISPTERPR
jgi:O-antigen/teichoic acid export membrane protein